MSDTKTKLKEIQKQLKAEEYEDVLELCKSVFKGEKEASQNLYHS